MSTGVLLHGGHVYTASDPFATAMLVLDGRVAWVGDDAGALVHRDAAPEVIDLRGALVTPAFVDAHVHATSTGLALTGLDVSGCDSLARFIALLAGCPPESGVLLGHGWDQTAWPERRAPTSADLDRVVGDRPAYLTRVDVHSAVVSSALLAMCPGVEALPGYDPSGLMSREAHHRVREVALGAVTAEQRDGAQRAALARAASQGIASVHEMAGPTISSREDLVSLLAIAASDTVPEVIGYWGEIGAVDLARSLGLRGLAGDLFVDGALGSHTACLRTAYDDAPDTRGADYLDVEQVHRHVVDATQAGLQAGFHMIGDRGSDIVLEGFRRAAETLGESRVRQARHRLEHVEMVDAQHMALMAHLGIVASVQPAFDAAWGGPSGMYVERVGPDRAARMNPFADMVRGGVILALGSDAPVTPLDPWGAVRAAAFHRTPGQRISVRAAFAAHTRGGRRAAEPAKPGGLADGTAGHTEGDDPGVLLPGAPATYAIWEPTELVVQAPDGRVAAWSTDPRSGTPGLPDVSPDAPLPRCWRTVARGTTIFDAGEWS